MMEITQWNQKSFPWNNFLKIDKALARMDKKKGGKPQIIKIRNQTKDILHTLQKYKAL